MACIAGGGTLTTNCTESLVVGQPLAEVWVREICPVLEAGAVHTTCTMTEDDDTRGEEARRGTVTTAAAARKPQAHGFTWVCHLVHNSPTGGRHALVTLQPQGDRGATPQLHMSEHAHQGIRRLFLKYIAKTSIYTNSIYC